MLKRKLRFLLLVAFVVSLALGAAAWYISRGQFNLPGTGTEFDLQSVLTPQQRLLVIAPHSDDETLGPGALINRFVRLGAQVRVVLLTNGDGFTWGVRRENVKLLPSPAEYIRYGEIRQQESLNALAALGLAKEDVTFLGYPDRGLQSIWLSHWDCRDPYRSPITKRTTSPYKLAFRPGTPYCGQAIVNDLLAIMEEFQPTLVVLPHPNDAHVDHWAGSNFTIYALETWKEKSQKAKLGSINTLFYLVHRGGWPQPESYQPDKPLTPPKDLAQMGTNWMFLPLTKHDAQVKHQAILEYKTQLKVLRDFLLRFVRTNELFSSIPVDVPLAKVTPHGSGTLSSSGAEWNDIEPVVFDPVEDTVKRTVSPASDITYVKAYHDNERIYIQVGLRGKASTLVTYHIRLVTFQPATPLTDRQYRIRLKPGKQPIVYDSSGRSRRLENQVDSRIEGNTVSVSIPLNVLNTPQRVFLSAATTVSLVHIDWTAWRLASL